MYETLAEDRDENPVLGSYVYSLLRKGEDQKFTQIMGQGELSHSEVAVNLHTEKEDGLEYFICIPSEADVTDGEFNVLSDCYICEESHDDCEYISIEENTKKSESDFWVYTEEYVCRDCVTELIDIKDKILDEFRGEIAATVI